jgi:hypothetical protein
MIAGVSLAAWRVILTTCISFLQWYLIGWVAQMLWQKWFGNAGVEAKNAAST